MIKLTKVSKIYEIDRETSFAALKTITLTIEKGEFISIIGPSGSGKSTLMHIIGLLDRPSSGVVTIEGRNAATLSDDATSHLRNEFVGFVFQQFNLINKLTVLENVLLPTLYHRGELPFDPQKRASELLTRFGIADKARSYPNKISGGQQQRAAIARALMMNPSLILADEPTGNLDSKTGAEIVELLERLNKEDGKTVVVVTHERTIAQKTKRKIYIQDGQIA